MSLVEAIIFMDLVIFWMFLVEEMRSFTEHKKEEN